LTAAAIAAAAAKKTSATAAAAGQSKRLRRHPDAEHDDTPTLMLSAHALCTPAPASSSGSDPDDGGGVPIGNDDVDADGGHDDGDVNGEAADSGSEGTPRRRPPVMQDASPMVPDSPAPAQSPALRKESSGLPSTPRSTQSRRRQAVAAAAMVRETPEGYCECCRSRYYNGLNVHRTTQAHRDFALVRGVAFLVFFLVFFVNCF
jgi:hypothetical protein